MPNKTTGFLIVILPVLLSVPMTIAQQSTTPAPPNPCTISEQKQLEFWVGDWDLSWPGPKAGQKLHGANRIQRIMDGCVV